MSLSGRARSCARRRSWRRRYSGFRAGETREATRASTVFSESVDPLAYGYLQRAHVFNGRRRVARRAVFWYVWSRRRRATVQVVWALEDDASVPRDVIERFARVE